MVGGVGILLDGLRFVRLGFFVLDLVHPAMEKVKVIIERIKTAQSRQKSYANIR